MTIVIDLDDTISVHKNRDYENAQPITATIEKLRKLKADGWEIVIYSSRGQNSCRGDLKLIEERNRSQIEKWLLRYDVPYDRLVFGKPLGDVYVDDKGIGLADFLDGEITRMEGNSGAEVQRVGNRIIKRGQNVSAEAEWYKEAREAGLNVPDVNSVVLDRIDVQYIEGTPGNRKALQSRDLSRLVNTVVLMGLIRTEEAFDVDGYLKFARERLEIAGWEEKFQRLFSFIEKNREEIRDRSSFSHGDFSLSNVIFAPDGIYLIDPSPRREFSSYLNDFAKLRFSLDGGEQLLHGGSRPAEYDARLSELSEVLSNHGWIGIVTAMETVHWIRMLKYIEGQEQTIWKKAKELEGRL